MEKGITLARQSNSKPVLANIKRGNIKLSSYAALQRRFNDLDVPVYTEMILGLPGETYESWRDGIQQILEAGLKNQLFVYQCEVYPNTEMGDPEYQRRFGIETLRTELREIHGSVRHDGWVVEYQDIIVASHSMSNADWRRMTKFATMTMLLHSMKLGFYVLGWLSERYDLPHVGLIEFLSERACLRLDATPIIRQELDYIDNYLDAMMAGAGRGCVLPGYLDIYWDIEEALFVRIAENLDAFFREFESIVRQYLDSKGVAYDERQVAEVVRYQRLRIPRRVSDGSSTDEFTIQRARVFRSAFSTGRYRSHSNSSGSSPNPSTIKATKENSSERPSCGAARAALCSSNAAGIRWIAPLPATASKPSARSARELSSPTGRRPPPPTPPHSGRGAPRPPA